MKIQNILAPMHATRRLRARSAPKEQAQCNGEAAAPAGHHEVAQRSDRREPHNQQA